MPNIELVEAEGAWRTMNPIEAAAVEYQRTLDYDDYFEGELPIKSAKSIVVAFFRAAVGCPTCKGTRVWKNDADMVHEKCPKAHVKITVFGETIWADPAKCEWRCEREWTNPSCRNALWKIKDMPWYREADHGHIANGVVGYHSLNYDEAEELAEREARGCGWQPRWDAINQETP